MFDKAMKKSVEPYLQPGEQLLNVTIVQGKGMMRAILAGGAIGAAAVGARRDRKAAAAREAGGDDGGVELANKMGLAITSQRLLIFKAGGAVTLSAKELLNDVPIGEVDSIEVGKGTLTKKVILSVRGEEFTVEAPRASNPDKLVDAFAQAKAGTSP